MAEENFPHLSWAELDELDAQNNNQGDLLVGDATSLARSIVNGIVDDATLTGELAVTVGEVRALWIC